MEIISYGLVGQGLIGVNIAAYATTINSKLNNITGSIKEFIVEHQTYIPGDLFDAILTIAGVKGIAAGGGIAIAVGFISAIVGEGDLILDFRDHYLPEEYWKYRIIQGHSMVMRLGLMLVRIIVYTILKYRRTLM